MSKVKKRRCNECSAEFRSASYTKCADCRRRVTRRWQRRIYHKKPEPEQQSGGPARRKCLMCEKTFDSSWSGNRICKSCKDTSLYESGDMGSPQGVLR